MFRIKNLLIHVLPDAPVICENESCGFVSDDCDDSAGCGESVVCDESGCDDSGCDDSGCDDSGCDDSGCGDSGCDDSGGCGDSCVIALAGSDCGDSGCVNSCDANSCGPNTGCDADTCDAGVDSGCAHPPLTACGGLHMRSECEILPNSEFCLPGLPTNQCFSPVTDNCQPGVTQCDAGLQTCALETLGCLTAVTGACPPAVTRCPEGSVIIAAQPAALCFRSDEPKLNPNSLIDLGVMRRQLTAYLKVVEARERALHQSLAPKTPAQLRIAEAILNSALKDLATQKQFLQSRALKKTRALAPAKKAPAKTAAKKAVVKKTATKKAAKKSTGRKK